MPTKTDSSPYSSHLFLTADYYFSSLNTLCINSSKDRIESSSIRIPFDDFFPFIRTSYLEFITTSIAHLTFYNILFPQWSTDNFLKTACLFIKPLIGYFLFCFKSISPTLSLIKIFYTLSIRICFVYPHPPAV